MAEDGCPYLKQDERKACVTGFEKKCQIWGWGLFIISAVFFLTAAVRAGDWMVFLGALFFFVACFVFLVPLLRR